MVRAAIVLCFLGCTKPQAPAVSCLDRELAARHLNEFGDAEGTMYPGGTPLFDEKTGKRTDRAEYVFSRHPDIRRASAPDASRGAPAVDAGP